MRILGQQAVLRRVGEHDIDIIDKWNENPVVRSLVGHVDAKSRKIRKVAGSIANPIDMGITTLQGKLIGYVQLDNISWRARSAELRICIGNPDYWGKGYGTEALLMFVDFVLGRYSIDYIYLRVYRANTRALKCYKKCGFKPEAVLFGGAAGQPKPTTSF